MKQNKAKDRTAVWLYPKTMKRMDARLTAANCKSRSEFIEQALDFYIGFLDGQEMSAFLPAVLTSSVEGILRKTENRVANNLFRLSVETGMMMHLLATTLDVTDEELCRLRGRCVAEVKKTRGKITLDEAVHFQQAPGEDS